MQVIAESRYGKCVARVVGDMDIYGASELKARLAELLTDSTELELNLSEVGGFDSAGAQLLLWLGQETAGRNVGFRINGTSPVVEELIGLYNLRIDVGAVADS